MEIGWPEGIVIFLYAIRICVAGFKHGEVMAERKYSHPEAVFSVAVMGGLLYWGGFFS